MAPHAILSAIDITSFLGGGPPGFRPLPAFRVERGRRQEAEGSFLARQGSHRQLQRQSLDFRRYCETEAVVYEFIIPR